MRSVELRSAESISNLSNEELLSKLGFLKDSQTSATLSILYYLGEIEERDEGGTPWPQRPGLKASLLANSRFLQRLKKCVQDLSCGLTGGPKRRRFILVAKSQLHLASP